MDSEEDALLVETTAKDNQIIDDQFSENDLKSDYVSNGNCNIITSPVPSRRSDEPTELSFEKSKCERKSEKSSYVSLTITFNCFCMKLNIALEKWFICSS